MDSAACCRHLLLEVAQGAGVEYMRTHVQLLGGFLGDGQRIAGHHLDLHAHRQRGRDGGLGIVPRRIEQGQHPHQLPFAVSLGPRHAERAKAARGELIDRLLHGRLHLPGVIRERKDHLRCALGDLKLLSVLALDDGLGAFVHRIERREVNDLVALQSFGILDAFQHGQIDGVVIVGARCERGVEDDLRGRLSFHTERITERQLVLRQGAGFIRA